MKRAIAALMVPTYLALMVVAVSLTGAQPGGFSLFMGRGWGNGAVPSEAVTTPYDLDYTDRLCVADTGAMQVRCVENGRVALKAQFSAPVIGVARDAGDGRIYVSTRKVTSTQPHIPAGLFVIDPSGTVRRLPLGASTDPFGLSVGGGFVWWADQQRNEAWRVEIPCITACTPELMLPASAGVRNPQDVFFKPGRGLYIADTTGHRIRLLDFAGNLTTVVGSTGGYLDGSALSAHLFFPVGLWVTDDDVIYIADGSNHRVRRMANDVVTTVAGNGSSSAANPFPTSSNPLQFALASPLGVAVDDVGTVYSGSAFLAGIYSFTDAAPPPPSTATHTAAATATLTAIATATLTATRTRTATRSPSPSHTPLPTCIQTITPAPTGTPQGPCVESM